MSTFDCRMIDVFPTSREPVRSLIDRVKSLQGRDGVLSVSLIHGFMAADVPEMGTRILVVTDNDKTKGDALARSLGLEVFSLRGKTAMPMIGTDAGLDLAAALAARKPGKPVVVADVWDNPGGGTAGDGTLILERVLARGMKSVAIASIWDPMAVSFCLAAGAGARIELRFGGKSDAKAGAPIDALVEVRRAVAESFQSFGGSRVTLGPAAVIRPEGTDTDIILTTNRAQTYEPDIFSNLGIDPLKKEILIVKSTNHFYAGFSPIAAEIIYVDAGAPYPSDPRQTNYTKLARKIWPRVENPHDHAKQEMTDV